MTNHKLIAKPRKLFGRRVKQLRAQGIVPSNIFGPKTKSLAISIDKKSFLEIYKKAGETGLITLSVEGEKEPRAILISNLHLHPVTNEILHADLHQVDLKTKTTASVPVEFTGESPAVKEGGVLVTLINELEVEALPTDLPEKIEVDISTLAAIGDTIQAKDLKLDRAKVELKIEAEEPVVTIQEQAKEEEPVVEEPAEGEEGEEGEGEAAEGEDKPEGDKEAKPEEGKDKPKEGKDKPKENAKPKAAAKPEKSK